MSRFAAGALLLAALAAGAEANRIAGDAAFTTGPGPFVITAGPGGEPPRLVDGTLRLGGPGSRLELPLSEPLEGDEQYCLAFQARGVDGAVLRVSVRDAFGPLESAELPLPAETTDAWLAFTARAAPLDASSAAAMGLDWNARWAVEPADRASEPAVSIALELLGPPGAAAQLDDLRLTPGASPRAVDPPRLAVDALIGSSAGVQVLWLERPEPLVLRAIGPGTAQATADVRNTAGIVVAQVEPAPPGHTVELDLALPVGWYEIHARVADGSTAVERRRGLLVLHDHSLLPARGPAISFDAAASERAAEAVRLGYRETRLVVTWAELADADGVPDLADLERRLAPLLAAGVRVTLAVRVTPHAAQPRLVRTERRMHSHGYDRDVPLPDFAAFERFAAALGRWFAGRGVWLELDDQPFRRWHAEDYSRYLAAWQAGVGDAAVGLGVGFGEDPPRLAPFLAESARRGLLVRSAALPVTLPGRLGDEPERWFGGVWPALLVDLAVALLQQGRPVEPAVHGTPVARPTEPPAGPRLVAPAAAGPGARQYAARLLRTWLELGRLQPAVLPSGWAGELGAAEAAVAVWREHYAAAALQTAPLALPAMRGLVLEQPDGRGLAAVWMTDDERADPSKPRADACRPELVLETIGGAGVRVRDLYGAERTELYGRPTLRVPVGFEPIYLAARSPGVLERLLAGARLDGHEQIALSSGLAMLDGRPVLTIAAANRGGTPTSGEIRLRADGFELSTERVGYQADPGQLGVAAVPIERWPEGTVGRLRLVAEAGRRMVDRARGLLSWPAEAGAGIVIDGREDDWPAAVPVYRLDGAEQRLEPASEWLGPDDASLRWRGAVGGGALLFWLEVTDDRLETAPRAHFDDADAVVLLLDLDTADSAWSGDDYRLWLTPVFDGQVQGRVRIDRGPGASAELLDLAAAEWHFAATTTGYRFELRLPLTEAGQVALSANQSFGLALRLHDDDGGDDRDLRLSAFGPAGLDRPDDWALVWLRRPGDRVGGLPPPEPTVSEPLARYRLTPGAAGFALTPERAAGARLRFVAVDDLVRGDQAVRVERSSKAPQVTVLELAPPSPPRPDVIAGVWARGTVGTALHLVGSVETIESVEWRRYDFPLPPGWAAPLTIGQSGTGWLELAEVTLREPRTPRRSLIMVRRP